MSTSVKGGLARLARPSLSGVIALGLAVWGLRIGLVPLKDNSLLTHLATGQHILDTGSVPTHDIFSFTAPDQTWVVQSWLATVIYAIAHEVVPGHGILAVNSVLTVTLALLVWRLTRPAETLLPRVAVAATAVTIGVATWVERPLLFGLVAMTTAILVSEDDRIPPWLLVPVGWLWVNVHGSWPLGLVYLAVRLAGRAAEQRAVPGRPEARPLGALTLGVALGAVNPLGPRLLVFPVELLQRADILRHVSEWRAPDFELAAERFFLAQLIVATVFLTRRSERWSDAMIVAVFGASALLSARNVAVASLVLVPVLARGLAGLGSVRGEKSSVLSRGAALLLTVVAALMVATAAGRPPFGLAPYPVRVLAFAHAQGVPERIAAPDVVGNLRGFVAEEGERIVFFDDRFDMWPEELVDDYLVLSNGQAGWRNVLEEWEIDAVIWEVDQPIVTVLAADSGWRVMATDGRWMLARPRPEAVRPG